MSFILDALRKSELERQRQSGPSIAEMPVARADRRLPAALLAIGLLLAVNVAVLLYFLLRDDTAAPARTPVASVAGAMVAAPPEPQAPSPEPLRAPEARVASDLPPPGSTRPPAMPAPDPTLLPAPPASTPVETGDEAPPPAALDTPPPQGTAGLAELSVDLHIYSDDPARRAVFINGRRYTEGMTLAEGPVVQEITRDGVVISYRGQRYLLPRN
jgi:general secretion pathway protein B